MARQVYRIASDSESLKDKIHREIETKGKITFGKVAGWVTRSLELQEDLAKRLDELSERLMLLEDELREKSEIGKQKHKKTKKKKGLLW